MLTNPQRNCGSGCIPFFYFPHNKRKNQMEMILKSSRGLHVRLKADDAEGLLKVSQLCELLEISYTGVRARIFRGETVEAAIHHFLDQKGGGDA
jgi:hypothetical protein